MTRQKELSPENREVSGAPERPASGHASQIRANAKLEELWSYTVFRWCVYSIPLAICVAGWVGSFNRSEKGLFGLLLFPTLIFPIVWVWRKPIWKVIRFLNEKAEED